MGFHFHHLCSIYFGLGIRHKKEENKNIYATFAVFILGLVFDTRRKKIKTFMQPLSFSTLPIASSDRGTFWESSFLLSLSLFSILMSPIHSIVGESQKEEVDVPLFELATIANATNYFSQANVLGEGGFGHVYKVNKHIHAH
jgi:hypothetical protein